MGFNQIVSEDIFKKKDRIEEAKLSDVWEIGVLYQELLFFGNPMFKEVKKGQDKNAVKNEWNLRKS